MTLHFFKFLKYVAPLRLHCYPPSLERNNTIKAAFGSINPRIEVSATTVDEVYIYNTVIQFSCDPAIAEMYLFDIPMSTKQTVMRPRAIPKGYLENRLLSYGPYFERKKGTDHVILSSKDMTYYYLRYYPFPSTNFVYFVEAYFPHFRRPHIREMVHYPQTTCCSNLPLTEQKQINWQKFLVFVGSIKMYYPRGTQVRRAVDHYLVEVAKHPFILHYNLKSRNIKNGAKKMQQSNAYSEYVVGLSPHGDSPIRKGTYDIMNCGCIPLYVADELTLPFEGLFFSVESSILGVEEHCVDQIGRTLCLLNEVKIHFYRENVQEIRQIYDRDFFGKFVSGHQEWGWMWHIFILTAYKKQLDNETFFPDGSNVSNIPSPPQPKPKQGKKKPIIVKKKKNIPKKEPPVRENTNSTLKVLNKTIISPNSTFIPNTFGDSNESLTFMPKINVSNSTI